MAKFISKRLKIFGHLKQLELSAFPFDPFKQGDCPGLLQFEPPGLFKSKLGFELRKSYNMPKFFPRLETNLAAMHPDRSLQIPSKIIRVFFNHKCILKAPEF